MASSLDRFLDKALKIRVGEGPKVGLMALYAANAIGAVVVGRTVRDALFLADRSKDSLPAMYIYNSLAVALLSWGYARIADRMKRDRLNAAVAVGWALVMALFFVAALKNGRATAPILYVAVEAMGSLVVIQFWTFAQDVFTSREAKRLFPLISAGGQAANVFYGFLASSFSKRLGAESLLLLCAANLVMCAILAWYIAKRYAGALTGTIIKGRARGDRQHGTATGLRILSSRHLLTIAAIGVVSAIVVNLVDYQFKAAAESHFHADRTSLGIFFGRFYGVCGAVALALQMGLTGRILERFGILASLLPLPIGLLFGSGMAYVLPNGWTASLAKSSDSIFRYTLNDASMQMLYVPVPQHQRGRAKALIDGILKPMSGVLVGIVLILLGKAHALAKGEIDKPDFATTAIIVVLAAVWWFLLTRGKDEYVRSLLDTLQRRRLDLQSTSINADQATAEALAKVLHSNDALAILHAIELLPNVRGFDFGPLIAQLLDHPVSSVKASAADHLARHPDARYGDKLRERLNDRDPWCVASSIGAVCALEKEKALPLIRPFLSDLRPAIRAAAVVGLVRHAGINGILEAADELKRQLNAQSAVERELAASLLGELGVPTFYDALIRFLQDPSVNVRRAALVAASRLRSPELVPYVIRHLARRETAQDAAKALVAYGTGIELTLGRTMHDESVPTTIRHGIPLVLGRLGTREAADLLQSALETMDPQLRAAAAQATVRLMRRRSDLQIRREVVVNAVQLEIAFGEKLADVQAALDLPTVDRNAAGAIVHGQGARMLLALALVEERDRAIQRAIVLLELLYPNAGLDVAADNLRSDSPARRANAVEVFDNTVKEVSKTRLLHLIEDRLIRPVPTGRTRGQWLSELILGPHAWTSACAAQVAVESRETGVSEALQRGLSSSVPYVREACANALWRLSPKDAPGYVTALKDDSARSVRRVIDAILGRQLASA